MKGPGFDPPHLQILVMIHFDNNYNPSGRELVVSTWYGRTSHIRWSREAFSFSEISLYCYDVTRLHIRCIVGLLWPWRNLSDCKQMGYTPLEEVNQAIYAWSYRQLECENYGQLLAKTLLKELVVSSWYGGHRHPVDEHLVYQDLVRHCHFVKFHYILLHCYQITVEVFSV